MIYHPAVSLDTETFYSKTYSIKGSNNYLYTHHEEFDPYLLTAAYEDGNKWVGHPLEFNWQSIDGLDWIFANAGFDLSVFRRLQELGKIPVVSPNKVHDVLDLARYLGFPGNLAGAAEGMLGIKLDKGVRDRAKGLHWHEMTLEFQEQMKQYALSDVTVPLEMWHKYRDQWPDWEQEISQMTREMCDNGLPVDYESIDDGVKNLQTELQRIRNLIPWAADDEDAKALSKKEVATECRKHNVLPPKSMAKDSEEFDEWLRKHGEKFQWAAAMGQYRSTNILLKKLMTMRERAIQTDKWGTVWFYMPFGLKYGGGHTLRDSGDSGLNVQNFNRKSVVFDKGAKFEIDMRGNITAPPGYQLGVMDLTAIEPCTLAVFSQDDELIALLNKGYDVYEAQARAVHGYADPEPLKIKDPSLRQLCKVEVLGLGYGAGAEKFITIAEQMAGMTIDMNQSTQIVADFRKRPFIPKLWRMLEADCRRSAGSEYFIELPSGRKMRYREVREYGGLSAVIPRMGKMMRVKLWGGTLTENLVQAAARDVFMDRVVALKREGIPPILRVHDEAVALFKEDEAEEKLKLMKQVMSTRPDWMPTLPLAAGGHLCQKYTKG